MTIIVLIVIACITFMGLLISFVIGITIQGKMTGGLTRKQAYKELIRELFGVEE